MPLCHICGTPIPVGSGLRKKLRTGTSVSGMAFTSRPVLDWTINSIMRGRFVGIRNSYALRTVCVRCAHELEVSKSKQNKTIMIAILISCAIFVAFTLISLQKF